MGQHAHGWSIDQSGDSPPNHILHEVITNFSVLKHAMDVDSGGGLVERTKVGPFVLVRDIWTLQCVYVRIQRYESSLCRLLCNFESEIIEGAVQTI